MGPGSDSAAVNALLSSPDTFGRSRSELVLTAPAEQFVDSAELRGAVLVRYQFGGR